MPRWRAGSGPSTAGGGRRAGDLIDLTRREAAAMELTGEGADRALARVEPGLRAYAEGPWPRLATLYLEQSVRHILAGPDGPALELHLRVDRVARHRRTVAILDFKTVTPHAFEMRADRWQLRTYALAAPDLLGVAPTAVELVIIDLEAGVDRAVSADEDALRVTAADLLDCAVGIARADFNVAGHEDRPCWSCGFRLQCPGSLAPQPPAAH